MLMFLPQNLTSGLAESRAQKGCPSPLTSLTLLGGGKQSPMGGNPRDVQPYSPVRQTHVVRTGVTSDGQYPIGEPPSDPVLTWELSSKDKRDHYSPAARQPRNTRQGSPRRARTSIPRVIALLMDRCGSGEDACRWLRTPPLCHPPEAFTSP